MPKIKPRCQTVGDFFFLFCSPILQNPSILWPYKFSAGPSRLKSCLAKCIITRHTAVLWSPCRRLGRYHKKAYLQAVALLLRDDLSLSSTESRPWMHPRLLTDHLHLKRCVSVLLAWRERGCAGVPWALELGDANWSEHLWEKPWQGRMFSQG